MLQEAMPNVPARAWPRRGHPIAAVMAAVVSVLLHAFLLSELPPLPLGSVTDQHPWQDYPAIRLGKVVRSIPEKAHPPARFRPENPQEVASVFGQPDVDAAMAAMPLPVPEAPETSTGPLKGESQALAEPSELPPRAAWDPRQEIIEIDHQIFDEKVSALPRRYTEPVQRSDRVPDVVLPVEQPADLVAALKSGQGPAGIESASRPTMRSQGAPWGAPTSAASGAQGPGDLLQEASTLAQAPETNVTEMEAVEQYLDLSTRVYRATDEGGAVYFEIEIRRHGDTSLPVLPKDVLLLQDCSESMTPSKLAECKRGLRRWLALLEPRDRFDILGFRDTTYRCFDAWTPLTPETRAKALAFIDDMRAVGNTDVYGSLEAALRLEHEPGRPVLAVLVTDGRPTTGVTGSSDIIERFSQANRAGISVFALGGGRRVNRFLLDLLSYRNRGDSLVVPDEDGIPEAMERWAEETRRPVLTDLHYQFTGLDTDEVYPRTLTHLYLDRPLVLYGRVDRVPDRAAFQIVGNSGTIERDMVFPLDLAAATPGTAEIRHTWAWQRVYQWIGTYIQTQDPALLKKLRDFADRYGLVVPYGYGRAVPRD